MQRAASSTLGRFGWKALDAVDPRSNPPTRSPATSAFPTPEVPRHWGDCTEAQGACLAMPTACSRGSATAEAPDPILDLVTFYSQNLAVPARRDIEQAEVLAGKKVFYELGCASCHTPKFVTRRDAPNKAQAFQLIWPYSDFLLHDMGEGLADGQQVGDATGSEWRTPPLWGIGLTETRQRPHLLPA